MKTITMTLAALIAMPVLSSAEGKSIYGRDNRLDYFESSAQMKTLSDSVVSLWESANLTAAGSYYKLATYTLKQAYNMCPGQKFAEQKVGAFCSGSLVGEDLVMTAGHCIKDAAGCAGTKFVFGFKVNAAGGAGPDTVARSEVYSCSKIVTRKLEEGVLGSDYALIKLDRKVTGHKPLEISRGADVKKGEGIFVIGHPTGLPVKVAGDATVRDAGKPAYFVANLDTFGGNSGSAVFSAATNKIVGILVRGDNDYEPGPAGCTVASVFPQQGGRGEDVTKISQLAAFIPGGKPAAPVYQPWQYVPPTMPRDNTYVAPSYIIRAFDR